MAKVACLVGPEFEDSEVAVPVKRLRDAGHEVEFLGIHGGQEVVGKNGEERIVTDASVEERRPDHYDALLIPGGYSPDHLRVDVDTVQFVREFGASGRPIAAVCHGPQLLIEAGLVDGVRMTSWPSVRTDLRNAGAVVVDAEVVEDQQFITSRAPGDLEAFSRTLIAELHRSEQLQSAPPHGLTERPPAPRR